MKRREILRGLGAGLVLSSVGVRGVFALPADEPVRIGLTPVFLDDQVSFLTAWRDYLAQTMGRPVEFMQRGSYREVVELLRQDKLQFAWLCGYPYVRGQRWMRLLAVPVYRRQPLYQSYLIVPERDTRTESILDLRDRVFAFSDPDSNSGYLYPYYQLVKANTSAANFFRRTFFTYAHKKVVEAVGLGIAHGGAVDGYVWDTLARTRPEVTGPTRVVERSPQFGFPPFVASRSAPPELFEAMQKVLLGMHEDRSGKGFLGQLNLDRFDAGSPDLFDGIARMVRAVGQLTE